MMDGRNAVWEVRFSHKNPADDEQYTRYRPNRVLLILTTSLERAAHLAREESGYKDVRIDQILKRTAQEILIDAEILEEVQ